MAEQVSVKVTVVVDTSELEKALDEIRAVFGDPEDDE